MPIGRAAIVLDLPADCWEILSPHRLVAHLVIAGHNMHLEAVEVMSDGCAADPSDGATLDNLKLAVDAPDDFEPQRLAGRDGMWVLFASPFCK